MADVVMDITGHAEGAITAVNLAKERGAVILPGLYGTSKEVPFLLDKIVLNKVRLQGVSSHDLTAVALSIKIVESRKYPMDKMGIHKFSLMDAQKAVQTVGGEI